MACSYSLDVNTSSVKKYYYVVAKWKMDSNNRHNFERGLTIQGIFFPKFVSFHQYTGSKVPKPSCNSVVVAGFEFVSEKNADPAKFCVLVKKICMKHLDKDVHVDK